MDIQAEVSLYPLGKSHLSRSIEAFVEALEEHGCHTEVGDMSTLVRGKSDKLFDAIRIAYEEACKQGGCVLIVHASNACPA